MTFRIPQVILGTGSTITRPLICLNRRARARAQPFVNRVCAVWSISENESPVATESGLCLADCCEIIIDGLAGPSLCSATWDGEGVRTSYLHCLLVTTE